MRGEISPAKIGAAFIMSVRPLALFPVVALAVLLSVMTVVAPCLAADRPASVTAKVTPPTREGGNVIRSTKRQRPKKEKR